MDFEWGTVRRRVRNFVTTIVRPSTISSRGEDVEAGFANLPASNPTIFINVRPSGSDEEVEQDQELQCNNVAMYLTFVKPTLAEKHKLGKKGQCCIGSVQVLWLAAGLTSLLNSILFLASVKLDFQTGEVHQSKYIVTGYIITDMLPKLLFLKLLSGVSSKHGLQKVTETLAQLLSRSSIRNATLMQQLSASKLAIFLVASSLVLALSNAIFGAAIMIINSDWAFTKVLVAHYKEICGVFLHPHFTHFNATAPVANSTSCEVTNITLAVVLFGLSGCLADYASYLIENSILDIFLLLTFTVSQSINILVKNLPNHILSATTTNSDRVYTTDICLRKYELLLKLSVQLDTVLGTLLKAMHVCNMLLIVYFTHEFFTGPKNGLFVLISIKAAKAALGYYFAVSVANKASDIRSWVRDYYFSIDDPNHSAIVKCITRLDEMTNIPIGIGMNGFYLNEQFIGTFVGIVITYFFILAESS